MKNAIVSAMLLSAPAGALAQDDPQMNWTDATINVPSSGAFQNAAPTGGGSPGAAEAALTTAKQVYEILKSSGKVEVAASNKVSALPREGTALFPADQHIEKDMDISVRTSDPFNNPVQLLAVTLQLHAWPRGTVGGNGWYLANAYVDVKGSPVISKVCNATITTSMEEPVPLQGEGPTVYESDFKIRGKLTCAGLLEKDFEGEGALLSSGRAYFGGINVDW